MSKAYSRLKSSPSPNRQVTSPTLAQKYSQTMREAEQHRNPPFFARVALVAFTLSLFWMAFKMRWQVGLWKQQNWGNQLSPWDWFVKEESEGDFDFQVQDQLWR